MSMKGWTLGTGATLGVAVLCWGAAAGCGLIAAVDRDKIPAHSSTTVGGAGGTAGGGGEPGGTAGGGGSAGAPGCHDDAQDGDETDVDCGGPVCAPCANDGHCLVASDCDSRFCDTSGGSPGVCTACYNDINCVPAAATWCDLSVAGGTCVAKKDNAEHCGAGSQCLSDHCVDTVCCVQATCDAVGDCNICNAPGYEGDCHVAPDNWGCDDGLFCNGADSCTSGLCTGHGGDPCALLQNTNDQSCKQACDETQKSCTGDETGTSCNDGKFCTAVDHCTNGQCGGTGDPCTGNQICRLALDHCVYHHVITVDGSLAEWTTGSGVGEDFSTSTSTYTAYVSWDDANLYVAMQGPAVASGSAQIELRIYIGTGAGSTTGMAVGPQIPSLPFAAGYVFSWQASGVADLYQGVSWTHSSAWGDGASDYKQASDAVELRIPFSLIGLPSAFNFALAMIDRANDAPSCGDIPPPVTFAAMPYASLVDGCNPAWGSYFHFDLTSPSAPGSYVALP